MKQLYAQVKFVQTNGLSKPYDYHISPKLVGELKPNDYVVIQSARSDYAVGVFVKTSEVTADPSIVTKSVVQRVDVPGYEELVL